MKVERPATSSCVTSAPAAVIVLPPPVKFLAFIVPVNVPVVPVIIPVAIIPPLRVILPAGPSIVTESVPDVITPVTLALPFTTKSVVPPPIRTLPIVETPDTFNWSILAPPTTSILLLTSTSPSNLEVPA